MHVNSLSYQQPLYCLTLDFIFICCCLISQHQSSLLHCAVVLQKDEVVQYLLENGIFVDIEDKVSILLLRLKITFVMETKVK